MMATSRTRVLFVCMGNICRSPLAEGVFLHKINQRGIADRFLVDSCGTGGWHAGERPDHRVLDLAKQRGIRLPSRARQIRDDDFTNFDHLLCMDEDNLALLIQQGGSNSKIRLLLDFDPQTQVREVPDPYYGGEDGFEEIYHLIDSATEALLVELMQGRK
ncbi:MAG: low molecular weight phosphotyrosine protein phosphatase [Planctomycetota bacterium]|nr:low molecular weight phosphotyrosine protein phosphatase [Planctomycetota bacterium]